MMYITELLYILGGQSWDGEPAKDLWHFFPWSQDAERMGEIPGRSQEQGSSQTGTGMSRSMNKENVYKYRIKKPVTHMKYVVDF